MRAFIMLFSCLLSVLIPLQKAGADDGKEIDESAIVMQCETAAGEGLDLPYTNEQIEALSRLTDCLQEAIETYAFILWVNENRSAEDVKSDLNKLYTAHAHYLWNLNTDHNACGGDCGTLGTLNYHAAFADFCRRTLSEIIAEINANPYYRDTMISKKH